jgi:multicomponent Na+:H+ antiporter subunit D
MIWSLVAVVLIPLAGGVVAFLAGHRGKEALAAIVSLGTLGASLAVASELWEGGAIRYQLGEWPVPLGINLYVDGLSAVMLILTASVGTGIMAFATGHFSTAASHERQLFWPIVYFLWAGMNGVYVAADLFNIYVVFEIVGLAAIALVTLAGSRVALEAAMRYMIAAFLGSLCYLMGVALLYAEYGVLDLFLIGELIESSTATILAFGLMAVGMVLKTALFPMHFWLPPAHSAASAPVSALLSALVIKTSFFVLLRLWFVVYEGIATIGVAQLLGVLGAVAILWGSFQALRQRRLKLLIAHSTVAQVGYMFLLFPLTALVVAVPEGMNPDWLNEAWSGVTYQIISHALAKGALFLAAGVVVYTYGSDRLGAMRGLYRRLPVTTFAIAIAGVSLTGLPPSSGFVAKWLIMKAAIGSGQWWWIPVIIVGGLLTAGYLVLILRYALAVGQPFRMKQSPKRRMEIAALVLALLAIIAGFRLQEPLELLIIGSPFPIDAADAAEIAP